jgi:hypothetical protein
LGYLRNIEVVGPVWRSGQVGLVIGHQPFYIDRTTVGGMPWPGLGLDMDVELLFAVVHQMVQDVSVCLLDVVVSLLEKTVVYHLLRKILRHQLLLVFVQDAGQCMF